jgi:hypothetical protein
MAHSAAEPSLLAQPLQKLCGECHDLKSAAFDKAHLGIKASQIDCRTCHDPHASKHPKLFKAVLHPPFGGGSCGDCHVTGK